MTKTTEESFLRESIRSGCAAVFFTAMVALALFVIFCKFGLPLVEGMALKKFRMEAAAAGVGDYVTNPQTGDAEFVFWKHTTVRCTCAEHAK